MRIIAHLLSVLLLVPGIVVSVVLLGIGHLAAQPNTLAMLGALFDLVLAFFPVALVLFVVWLGLALMGFSTSMRRGAAISVGAVAAATTAHLSWASGWTGYVGETGILVPGACALVIAIWLASTDWADDPGPRNAAGPAPPSRRLE